MYDFHKIKEEKWEQCFIHPQFKKGAKHSIPRILRKANVQTSTAKEKCEEVDNEEDILSKINESISTLCKRLETLEQRENDYTNLMMVCTAVR